MGFTVPGIVSNGLQALKGGASQAADSLTTGNSLTGSPFGSGSLGGMQGSSNDLKSVQQQMQQSLQFSEGLQKLQIENDEKQTSNSVQASSSDANIKSGKIG